MQPKNESNKHKAFTIVELLTVMSVIIILIGLLVPALNQVKRYAKEVKQRAQFHSIDVAMELFQTEHDGYPPSNENGEISGEMWYCGAMKLAEAMVGQDLLGFHPDSVFSGDLRNPATNKYLYLIPGVAQSTTDVDEANLKSRKKPYIELQNANATRLEDIYGATGTGSYNQYRFVLCDVYTRVMPSGLKTGMPILYYKANTSGTNNPNKENGDPYTTTGKIYEYKDNDRLVKLDMPWTPAPKQEHAMASDYSGTNPDGGVLRAFYWQINNNNIGIDSGRPYREDSCLLLSAGFDGEYGTRDDIYNFQK